jgi:hypothetical protein
MVEDIAKVVANLEGNLNQSRSNIDKTINSQVDTLAHKLEEEVNQIKKRQEQLC